MNTFAMIFPGQGCQKIGMLKPFKEFSIIKNIFNESSEILKYDLWKIIENGPYEILNKTEITQPAILTTSFAIWKIWKNFSGENPQFMAGHSLGEYSALVCANGLSFSDAVKIVALRGKFMQELANNQACATSAIIGLSSKIIHQICKQFSNSETVSIANFNSPNQVVISGYKSSVIQVMNTCQDYGAKYIKILPINIPSHSYLMKPAAKKLSKFLDTIKFFQPKIPVISSIDTKIQNNPKKIKKTLIRQIYSPILWNKTIQYLINQKIYSFLEVGPGNILSKLIKDFLHITDLYGESLNHPRSIIQQIKKYKKLVYAI
ncbi:malonyl-CoA-[acyl-carrier-protein] transacylase [Wigglesworthia glossinidia endosymbiont of Glossina morsitans morsitans (Yale colony)]|uniref:Malonyl CoA-acyl carrier protein transacylase n=1 Tax=Wigglesworthia glossinidia endosymbiont of Glossina morsitans morsitans (Yale colony) TaxID=1142511 RepID=H6Q5Q0_WIGGL|nr:ACP S-malonyltransferase [Wigglesworthia glossinidia]AFA40955.1 malonyl-CoA-[acyl-carrier-protein] transacylase [Wigglesworthia glossinidia endosymbiont of Glossina morsitans morsitans (Yale colony)]